jgi:hypothetical protein
MAGPTKAVLEQMLRLEQAKRANAARGMNRAGGRFQTMENALAFIHPQSPLPARTDLPPDYHDLRRTAIGAGGATDNVINTAKDWFSDLGRNSAGYDLRNKPRETLWERPLGGYGQAFLENVGMPADQAQVGERIGAAALSSVVGIPALMAAYDGLFGESQSIGTLPVTVVAPAGY